MTTPLAWKQWLQQGASSNSEAATDQAFVTNTYSLLAIATLALFGVVHVLTEQNPAVGLLELAGGLLVALNALLFHVTQNNELARSVLLLIIFGLLIALFVTGGAEATGVFWLFIFPASAFFLAGMRVGLLWVGALMTTIVTLGILRNMNVIMLPYSYVTFRQVIASLVVVSICIYAYQRARERAVKRTVESQQDLQEHLDYMTTLSAKISPNGAILFANKAAKQASGLGERFVGASFFKVGWWGNNIEVKQRVHAAFTSVLSGKPITYDETFKVAAGRGYTTSVFNFSMIPVPQKGAIKYVLAEGRDITPEKEIERAKSEFVTLASHQLRTPISAIAWDSELMLSGDVGKLKPAQQRYMNQIYQSNGRLAALVDAMLTASHLELGSMPINPEVVDVTALARQVLQSQKKTLAAHKHLTIQENYDPNLKPILVDPTIIKTVLHNLLANAFKYTPAKGTVTLNVSLSNEKLGATTSPSLLIKVADTGLGIPKKDQSKIFTRLFRADNVKHSDTDGTGLGLYIVKTLSEYVGGRIWFSSNENKGSQFSVLIPTTMKPRLGVQIKKNGVA